MKRQEKTLFFRALFSPSAAGWGGLRRVGAVELRCFLPPNAGVCYESADYSVFSLGFSKTQECLASCKTSIPHFASY